MSSDVTRRPVGRPPLVPGERAVEIRFHVPVAAARGIAAIAEIERRSLHDVCRRAIADFLRNRARSQARLGRRLVLTRGRIGL